MKNADEKTSVSIDDLYKILVKMQKQINTMEQQIKEGIIENERAHKEQNKQLDKI